MKGAENGLAAATVFALSMAAATGARAEPALEEVIVTAQKRAENLQDTPISIAVLGPESIEAKGITNIGDLAAVVPNLRVMPFGVSPTTLRLYMRGVGGVDAQITEDQPVGVYLNGVYVARPVGLTLDVANIERIEVLRGPQGTLYGRNTTGGAINIITRKPSEKGAFSQLLTAGNLGAFVSQTTFNVPLGDRFFASGSFGYNKRDGWLENTGAGPDFSYYKRKAGRLDLRWLATDAVTVDYSYDRSDSDYTADYYHLSENCPTGCFVPNLPTQPGRLDSAALAAPFQPSNDLGLGHALTVTVQTPWGEFKSLSSYRKAEQDAYNDYSGNPFATVFLNNRFLMKQDQRSQEFQLVGSPKGLVTDYVAGLYYFQEKGRERATDYFFTFPLPRNVTAKNTSYAAYGQASFRTDAASPWSYTFGARYTRDKREGDNNIPRTPATPNSGFSERSFSNFSPSITAEYRLSDAVKFYGKVVQGYKAGGFNLRQGTDFGVSFGPEKLRSYELGWKSEIFDRRLRLNGALFYADYKDIQLDINPPNNPDPTVTQTRNAGKARITGLELELTYAATDSLRFNGSYAYLDTKVKEVLNENPKLWFLPNAPKNTFTATVDWDVAKLPVGALNLNVDYSWRDDSITVSKVRATDPDLSGDFVPSYGLLDARLSLTGDDWFGKGVETRIALWGRNLTDEEYYKDTFGSFGFAHAFKVSTYGAPRTFGIDVRVSF